MEARIIDLYHLKNLKKSSKTIRRSNSKLKNPKRKPKSSKLTTASQDLNVLRRWPQTAKHL